MNRFYLVIVATIGLAFAPALGRLHAQEAPVAKKFAVPAKEKQDAALATIRDVFQKDYAAAKSSQQQAALADKMLETARGTLDDPASKYVLLRVARDIYVKLGDVDHVQAIAEEMEGAFALAGVDFRLEGLIAVGKTASGAAKKLQVAQALAGLIDQAVRLDQYPQANDAANAALGYVKGTNDKDLVKWLAERQAAIARQQALYLAAKQAIDKGDTGDPAANLAAGQYYAFVKQDWKTGLEMLKKGASAEMAAAAATDLAAPTEAAEMLKLADDWWSLADKTPDLEYGLKSRAHYWYRAALPNLNGIAKVRAEQRLASAAPAAGERDPWFTLFRSGVPTLWNKTYSGPHGKSVALGRAPAGVKYLRMTMHTKEPATIIVEMTNDRLGKKSAGPNYGWDGTGLAHHGGVHLGIYCLHNRTGNKGIPTITDAENGRSYTGHGFGHMYGEDTQCLSWDGKSLPPGTIIEISVTSEPLTAEEQKLLLK